MNLAIITELETIYRVNNICILDLFIRFNDGDIGINPAFLRDFSPVVRDMIAKKLHPELVICEKIKYAIVKDDQLYDIIDQRIGYSQTRPIFDHA